MVWQWLSIAALLAAASVLAMGLQWLVIAVGSRLTRRTQSNWDNRLVSALNGPLALVLFGLIVEAGTSSLQLPMVILQWESLLVRSLSIFSAVWLARRVLALVVTFVTSREEQPSGRYRSIRTQFEFTRRILEFSIWFVGGAIFLLQFEVVRNVGVSLLASAGLAGVVLGFAAQKSLASLFAGIQLSITQPIRLGDVVVIETQFGTIEEIRFTYVVVRTWDNKRLIVPITQFLEKTFENWSLVPTPLLGAVSLKVDFRTDVDAVRAHLELLLTGEKAKALWDGNVKGVQITESDHQNMTLRVLVSAPGPTQAWDLRCLLREGLLQYLRNHPDWLPRNRGESFMNQPTSPVPP